MDSQRYYIKKSLVPIEEDDYHEFKGHRNIAVEEVPPYCYIPGTSHRRSRKAVSRNLAAFLNSGRGGTVYLGIIDEGIVKGLYLTKFQKDHVVVSVKDLFSRYQPPVPDDMYEIVFVPVVGNDGKLKDAHYEKNLDKETAEKHLLPHLLRTYDFCWCDKDLAKRIDDDEGIQGYVIEIKIYPQKATFRFYNDESFQAVLPIVYQNEENKCIFRRSASCVEYSLEAVQELAHQQLKDLYEPLIGSMRQELDQIMRELGIT